MDQKITATKVEDSARMEFLPRVFGERYMLLGERTVYAVMDHHCSTYNGGYWEYYDLSNGGFYMAPKTDERFVFSNEGLQTDSSMSADAVGIVATLYALSELSNRTEDEKLGEAFHLLRAFASQHAEIEAIFTAID